MSTTEAKEQMELSPAHEAQYVLLRKNGRNVAMLTGLISTVLTIATMLFTTGRWVQKDEDDKTQIRSDIKSISATHTSDQTAILAEVAKRAFYEISVNGRIFKVSYIEDDGRKTGNQ